MKNKKEITSELTSLVDTLQRFSAKHNKRLTPMNGHFLSEYTSGLLASPQKHIENNDITPIELTIILVGAASKIWQQYIDRPRVLEGSK